MTKVLIQCSLPLAAIILVSQVVADPALQQVAWPAVDALRVPAPLTVSAPTADAAAPVAVVAVVEEPGLAQNMELPDGAIVMIPPLWTLTAVTPDEDPRR